MKKHRKTMDAHKRERVLKLQRETVRRLESTELASIAGGYQTPVTITIGHSADC